MLVAVLMSADLVLDSPTSRLVVLLHRKEQTGALFGSELSMQSRQEDRQEVHDVY